jgi:hypothetical protein
VYDSETTLLVVSYCWFIVSCSLNFCLSVQAFHIAEKTKPAAFAAGFLFVGMTGQISNLFIHNLIKIEKIKDIQMVYVGL